MRKIVKEFYVYNYSELSKEAKEIALENYRKSLYYNGYFWEDEFNESLAATFKLFDCEVSEDRNYNFYIENMPDNLEPEKMDFKRTIAYINNRFNFKKLSYYYRNKYKKFFLNHTLPVNNKYYEDNMLTGYCADYVLLETYNEFIEKQKQRYKYNASQEAKQDKFYQRRKTSFNLTLEDFFNMLLYNFEKERNSDREYQESEECFMEYAELNEYEFLKDGTRY